MRVAEAYDIDSSLFLTAAMAALPQDNFRRSLSQLRRKTFAQISHIEFEENGLRNTNVKERLISKKH